MENVKIINNRCASDLCLIAISSNGLKSNKVYEWENIVKNRKFKNFKKIIFLRDLTFRFFINGINNELNNINKIIDFLRVETKGLKVYTIGISSGGYLAMILGIFLENVERVFSIGGVTNILNWHGSYCDFNFNEFDEVKKANESQEYYFSINKFAKQLHCTIYGVYAIFADADKPLVKDLLDMNSKFIKVVTLNTKKHGDYLSSYDYIEFLFKGKDQLDRLFDGLENQIISKRKFTYKNLGFFKICITKFDKIRRKIFKN